MLMTVIATVVALSVRQDNTQRKIEVAWQALEQGRLEKAELRFRNLIRSLNYGREEEECYWGLAQTLEHRNRIDEALETYRQYRHRYERTGRGDKRLIKKVKTRCRVLENEVIFNRESRDNRVSVTDRPVEKAIPIAHRPTQVRILNAGERSKPIIRIRESNPEMETPDLTESAPVAEDHDPEAVQRVIGKYLVGDKLGEGGFGEVYQAYLPVAIKIAKNPDLIDNLKRLSTLQSKVKSPRIVAPFEVNLESDPPYVVMEHVDGPDMRELLRSYEELPPQDAVGLIHEVALALKDAHDAGVLHLDLKPENVLLSNEGHVKLTDFELGQEQSESARAKMQQSLASVDDESLKGTVAYMSPEQRFSKDIDHRSDIYTLGVMLFESLSKEMPEPGDKPSDFVAHLPEEVDRIFERCFARKEKRYESAGELIRDLERALQKFPERPNLKKLVQDLRNAQRQARRAKDQEPSTQEPQTSEPVQAEAEPPKAVEEQAEAAPESPSTEAAPSIRIAVNETPESSPEPSVKVEAKAASEAPQRNLDDIIAERARAAKALEPKKKINIQLNEE